MASIDKDSAKNLALAFLRKAATQSRFSPRVIKWVETDAKWIFDFHHRRRHELRRRGIPFGTRVAVDKHTGKAAHHAVLQDRVVA